MHQEKKKSMHAAGFVMKFSIQSPTSQIPVDSQLSPSLDHALTGLATIKIPSTAAQHLSCL